MNVMDWLFSNPSKHLSVTDVLVNLASICALLHHYCIVLHLWNDFSEAGPGIRTADLACLRGRTWGIIWAGITPFLHPAPHPLHLRRRLRCSGQSLNINQVPMKWVFRFQHSPPVRRICCMNRNSSHLNTRQHTHGGIWIGMPSLCKIPSNAYCIAALAEIRINGVMFRSS